MLWLAVLFLQVTPGPTPLDGFIAKDKAHLLLPPSAIASNVVRAFGWSHDGKQALVLSVGISKAAIEATLQRGEAPSESKWTLMLWNEDRARATSVLDRSTAVARPPDGSEVMWAGSSAYLLDQFPAEEEIRCRLIYVSSKGKAIEREFSAPSGEYSLVGGMGSEAGALVLTQNSAEGISLTIRFLLPGGPEERAHRVVARRAVFEWLATKNQLAFLVGEEPRRPDSWRSIGLDGSIVARTEFLGNEVLQAKHPFSLFDKHLVLPSSQGGTKIESLWIKSDQDAEKSEALVSADSSYENASIAPTGDAILYVSRGVAMTRRIVHLDKVLYLQMRDAAQRTEAIMNAKRFALALLMYSADNDDVAPRPGDRDRILPYLKDRSILDQFVYTFPGGSLEGLKNPSEVEIGYMEGPGGRAIAYADGHVKWRKD